MFEKRVPRKIFLSEKVGVSGCIQKIKRRGPSFVGQIHGPK
jgi:hypothetical protein